MNLNDFLEKMKIPFYEDYKFIIQNDTGDNMTCFTNASFLTTIKYIYLLIILMLY